MIRLILFIFIVLINKPLYAQDSEIKTIFDGKFEHLSGYGGTFMSFSRFNGQFAQIMGGNGALLLNHKIIIGGYGKSLTTDVLSNSEINEFENTKIKLNDGGLMLGLVHTYYSAIHITTYCMAGYGVAALKAETVQEEKGILSINPVMEIEMNITQYLRFGFGANYNLYYGIERIADLKADNFRTPGIFISFKAGWF